MHPLIRHLASRSTVTTTTTATAIRSLALLAFISLATGCAKDQTPKVQRPAYPNLGLREVPAYLKGTVIERTDVRNTSPLPVSSYGLVVNLRHSGDSKAPPPVRDWMVKEMYRHGFQNPTLPGYGKVTPESVLADPRTAIVMVGGYVPPGAHRGQRIDVVVHALPGSDTASLAGGQLWRCDLRLRGVNPVNPGGSVNRYIQAEGPIFINPALALEIPGHNEPAARSGSRLGTVIGGGQVAINRPLHLQLRTPGFNLARGIQVAINTRFPSNPAAAQDQGIVHLIVPESYKGNWQHFVGVVNHLFINQTPAQAAKKAQELAEEAKKPGAGLENISYALEALGPVAVPAIMSLLSHPQHDVQYAAARAGAFVGDRASEDALTRIALTAAHPFRINAITDLGQLPNNAVINGALARCLDADEAQVRIEAYKVLAENNDPNIYSYAVSNGRSYGSAYIVDEVRSGGKPMIYATRTGTRRLAIFGDRPRLNLPLTFSAFDHQLTISSDPERRNLVSIFYRGDELQQPVKTLSGPSVVELAARLGGAGDEKLRFGYGEVVAMLQSMVDSGKVSASFVMQDLAVSPEDFEESTSRETYATGRPVGEPAGAKKAPQNRPN